jgi:ferritin-like metal-binding protein YciE
MIAERERFADALADALDVERRQRDALALLAGRAALAELRSLLARHAERTDAQIGRLLVAFHLLGRRPVARPSGRYEELGPARSDLIARAGRSGPHVQDVAVVGCALEAARVEIVVYGELAEWAGPLGIALIGPLVVASLGEEGAFARRAARLLPWVGRRRGGAGLPLVPARVAYRAATPFDSGPPPDLSAIRNATPPSSSTSG